MSTQPKTVHNGTSKRKASRQTRLKSERQQRIKKATRIGIPVDALKPRDKRHKRRRAKKGHYNMRPS